MFDLGLWGEFLIIIIAILIFIRPDDIPGFISAFIKLVKKIQSYINEIKIHFDNLGHDIDFKNFQQRSQKDFNKEIKKNINKIQNIKNKTEKNQNVNKK